MLRRGAKTSPGCLIALITVLSSLIGASLGMTIMADADPSQFACPPGLIWGANGAELGGFVGLIVGFAVSKLVSRRDEQSPIQSE